MTRTARLIKTGLALAFFVSFATGFTALGVWQIQRLGWKLDLIDRVEARIHAEPVAVPGRTDWASAAPADIEYRRVTATGAFLPGEALVKAVTARGGGFWALSPFQTDDGFIVLINRGFIPSADRAAERTANETAITGLVRLTEPGGGFLRANEPENDRWFSRDVDAIAERMDLRVSHVAPFFIDAATNPSASPGDPIGGLTVVRFKNNHLIYALTWFALALMSLAGAVLVVWRRKEKARDADFAALRPPERT